MRRNKLKPHDYDGEKTQKYFNELCSVFYESGFEQEQIEDMVNHTVNLKNLQFLTGKKI